MKRLSLAGAVLIAISALCVSCSPPSGIPCQMHYETDCNADPPVVGTPWQKPARTFPATNCATKKTVSMTLPVVGTLRKKDVHAPGHAGRILAGLDQRSPPIRSPSKASTWQVVGSNEICRMLP